MEKKTIEEIEKELLPLKKEIWALSKYCSLNGCGEKQTEEINVIGKKVMALLKQIDVKILDACKLDWLFEGYDNDQLCFSLGSDANLIIYINSTSPLMVRFSIVGECFSHKTNISYRTTEVNLKEQLLQFLLEADEKNQRKISKIEEELSSYIIEKNNIASAKQLLLKTEDED